MGLSIKNTEKIQASSGNVFADLKEPDAAELDTKVRLAVAINRQLDAAHAGRGGGGPIDQSTKSFGAQAL
jgi:hypothetical protein